MQMFLCKGLRGRSNPHGAIDTCKSRTDTDSANIGHYFSCMEIEWTVLPHMRLLAPIQSIHACTILLHYYLI